MCDTDMGIDISQYAADLKRLLECTGRFDLALLGLAIRQHESGPPGYEYGYGMYDSGPQAQWRGRQIEGVCHDLQQFFGRFKPVTLQSLREFNASEWRASDEQWPDKVWQWYRQITGLRSDLSKVTTQSITPSGKLPPNPRYTNDTSSVLLIAGIGAVIMFAIIKGG